MIAVAVRNFYHAHGLSLLLFQTSRNQTAVSSIFVGIYLIAPVDEDEDEEDEEFCSKEEFSSRQRKDSLTVGVDIGDICNVQQVWLYGGKPES